MAKVKRVLVAEDERPMSTALQLKLTHCGFETDVAANGEEALALLKKNKYDLVLLDLMMPKVDGFGVLTEMKKRKDKTPVIITSNLSQQEDANRAAQLGAKDFLVKSDTPIAMIVEKIKKF